MSLHLITGYGGTGHITSADDGSFNAAMFGSGSYVLDRGNKFSASATSNNTVRILDGDIIMQGRHVRLNENSYEDVTIENGSLDMKRHDLIVIRYEKDSDTGIESCSFAVIKGTASAIATDPEYTDGNILNGAAVSEMPLYRVKLNGFTLEAIEPMFMVKGGFAEAVHKHKKADITDFPKSLPADGGNANTVNGHTVDADVPAGAKFTDTNTWRGIQNNLESESTEDSLSAAQGKMLNEKFASYSPSTHKHAASKITAGTLSGKVLANATAVATLEDKQLRNIYAGTTDMTAGESALPTGDIYIYYE